MLVLPPRAYINCTGQARKAELYGSLGFPKNEDLMDLPLMLR